MVHKQPYAVAGERVVCQNGHHICSFVCTVYIGDPENVVDTLGDWQQPPPAIGTPVDQCVCAKCGLPFYRGLGTFHFEDGWRFESPYPTVRTLR